MIDYARIGEGESACRTEGFELEIGDRGEKRRMRGWCEVERMGWWSINRGLVLILVKCAAMLTNFKITTSRF